MSKDDGQTPVDPANLEATKQWLQSQRGNMPPVVADTLVKVISLYQTLVLFQGKRQKMYTLLKQIFRLESKSERGKGHSKKTETSGNGKKLTEEEKAARRQKIEEKRVADAEEVRKTYAESLGVLSASFAPVDRGVWQGPIKESAGSTKTTPSESRADSAFVQGFAKSRASETDRPGGSEKAKPGEGLLRVRSEDLYAFLRCMADREAHNLEFESMKEAFPDQAGRSLQSDYHTRTIWDVNVVFTRNDLRVQTVTDRVTGERRSVPVDLAPPNWRHSYQLISFFVMMVVNFLIPMSRLSRMFGTPEKRFSVGSIWNMVRFAANCAEPIYKVLATQLGKSAYLEGDDTGTRCHQMKKSKDEIEEDMRAKKAEEPEDPDPFEATAPLVERVAGYLGRFFAGKTVEEKSGVHLSMVTSRTEGDDERSRVIFYRTHRGTVGDLLGTLWSFDTARRTVKFTCDLNAQNVPAKELRKHIDLTIGGCVAHLRRGIRAGVKLESAEDDCRYVLQLIRRLYDIERMARDEGNTPELIHWYRQRYGRVLWNLIFEKIEAMSKKWMKNTGDLGDHLAYCLKNRKAFMVYLDDPRMPIDNNFSERNLRPEKIHMANSRQRLTEEGRVAFDILLTMIRTCACAQVSPQDWLIWVMKNREQVRQQPEKYTPYQYHLLQKAEAASGN